jgi:hypothetical protein
MTLYNDEFSLNSIILVYESQITTPKGLMAGNLEIIAHDSTIINCSSMKNVNKDKELKNNYWNY